MQLLRHVCQKLRCTPFWHLAAGWEHGPTLGKRHCACTMKMLGGSIILETGQLPCRHVPPEEQCQELEPLGNSVKKTPTLSPRSTLGTMQIQAKDLKCCLFWENPIQTLNFTRGIMGQKTNQSPPHPPPQTSQSLLPHVPPPERMIGGKARGQPYGGKFAWKGEGGQARGGHTTKPGPSNRMPRPQGGPPVYARGSRGGRRGGGRPPP